MEVYNSDKDSFLSLSKVSGNFVCRSKPKTVILYANSVVKIPIKTNLSCDFLNITVIGNCLCRNEDLIFSIDKVNIDKIRFSSKHAIKSVVLKCDKSNEYKNLYIKTTNNDSVAIYKIIISDSSEKEYKENIVLNSQQLQPKALKPNIPKRVIEGINNPFNVNEKPNEKSKVLINENLVSKELSCEDIIFQFVRKVKDRKLIANKNYGKFLDVCNDVNFVLKNAYKRFLELQKEIDKDSLIVFDSAGIGDVVHSRLVVQHLAKTYKKISWIVPPITEGLYKDDKLINVYAGIPNRFRSPYDQVSFGILEILDVLLKKCFPNNEIINIPYNLCKYIRINGFTNFDKMWHVANKIDRDKNIKHQLAHFGKLENLPIKLNDKYIVIEYTSYSNKKIIPLNKYVELSDKLKELNISCVYVGENTDPVIEGCIDGRGLSLYDTVTLIKNSCGFLCRGSGNECLSVFAPYINLFELNASVSLKTCEGYYDNNLVHILNENNFIDYIYDFLKNNKFSKPDVKNSYTKINVDNVLENIDEVIIHCSGKNGEIFAASSIAKYIKNKNKNINIKWEAFERYFPILELIPYVDEKKKIDCDNDLSNTQSKGFEVLKLLNEKEYSWVENGILHLNPYYKYIDNKDLNKPFNERFFDCLGVDYSLDYLPDLQFNQDVISWGENFINTNNKFGFVFPFGHGVNNLSFKKQEYDKIYELVMGKGCGLIFSGIKNDLNFKLPGIDLFGLDMQKLLFLLSKSSFVIGVNSGIVFSGMFLGVKNIIIEDERLKIDTKNKLWHPSLIKLKHTTNIMHETLLNVNKLCDFLNETI